MPSVNKRTSPRGAKPAKPYPAFPLFPHATGRWAKKIRGRFVFFGPWRDPHGSLARFLEQRDDLFAGRVPRARQTAIGNPDGSGGSVAGSDTAGLTIRELANRFLSAKQRKVDAGEMGKRGFSDYHAACRRLIAGLGSHRRVDDITAGDFGLLRAELARTRGPVTLGNEIGRVRSIFKYGYEAGLMGRPVRFGPEFVKPSKRTMRLARHAQGERMFEATEIHTLLKAASPTLRAMILLGINCGLGNSDIAELRRSAIDLGARTLDYPRPKTGISRRAVLWPETVAAVRAAMKERPKSRDPAVSDLVFVTKYGHPWVRVSAPGGRSKGRAQAVVSDAVGLQFGRLIRATKTYRPGRSFYGLRHSFRTVADELGDRRAVDRVMGHENGGDIATHYVERISDDRLKKVSEHVRRWALVRDSSKAKCREACGLTAPDTRGCKDP